MIVKRNSDLIRYLNSKIRPQYKTHDGAHDEQHLEEVMQRAIQLANFVKYKNLDMVITAAYFHDTGLKEGRDGHELRSGDKVRKDINLRKWFSEEEIEEIAQAVEDHRASLEGEPRTMLGKIISDADRVMIPGRVIQRSLKFNSSKYPEKSREEIIEIVWKYLKNKYGSGGYAKLWISYPLSIKEKKEFERIVNSRDEFFKIANQVYDNFKK